jgi:sugar phosphate isomerase/epimerase
MNTNSSKNSGVRQAIGTGPWGGPSDRFMRAGYREAMPVAERLQRVAELRRRGLVEGLETRYPGEVNEENVSEFRQFLSDNDLDVAAVGTPISSSPQFGHGSLTARDPAVRRAAIGRVKAGLDICAEIGGDRVYFFLGQDGCDYPFEVDYGDAWNWIIEGLSEIAAHRQDVRVCVEYKPFEPRRRIFVNNVGISLHVFDQIGADNLGAVFDAGHAMMVGENLGESIYLLSREKRLFHVHFTDNYRNFDDDMIVGSVHFVHFLEAVYWLKRVGYTGWQSLDLYPYREDPDVAVTQSIRLLKRLDAFVNEMGLDAITELIHQGDGGRSLQEIYGRLLRA